MAPTIKNTEFKSEKIEKILKKFKNTKQKVKGYDVGFFKEAVYETGEKVAVVAFDNNFGTDKIPSRPFFQIANKSVEKPLVNLTRDFLTKENGYVLSEINVKKMGLLHEGTVKNEITKLRTPPNSPKTIKQKKSDNPLIDSGKMRQSVISKVIL